ncbi:hypothetical protein J2Z32_001351 [Paenibacillus turicensis]|uniref:Uncharacterized protein n=1 Tax=Paenibacillus turicensis TaxID=160487 RepID=A0ABS4FQ73_9BACL|nr:hypothetical protein [Paenibacillus turicensis]MBP1904727.1 hypothetical protein [Paenibacillus turicensis]
MRLLVGTKINDKKIKVETIYNLDVSQNDSIDRSIGVVVEDEITFPEYEAGKGYQWFVNPITAEQWLEEIEVPLTPEEQTQVLLKQQQVIIDQLVLDSLGGAN